MSRSRAAQHPQGLDVRALKRAIAGDLARAFRTLARLPLPGEYLMLRSSGQASGALRARWFETRADHAVDWQPFEIVRDPETGRPIRRNRPTPIRLPPPRAAEIELMDFMLDLWLTLEAWERSLVSARALKSSWADIAAADVKRRGRSQLNALYDRAVLKLAPGWLKDRARFAR